MTAPIDCAKHDYLEAACVLKYQVRLSLRNGTEYVGWPKTTKTLPSKVELLVVEISKNQQIEIALHDLKLLEVLDPNPRFSRVTF